MTAIDRWRDLGFGMFVHFGVYSAFGGIYEGKRITTGYSEQIMQFAPIPKADYLRMANTMTLERFDAKEYVELAKRAGMKYIVFTAKHHDGFCMYQTRTTSFNVLEQTPFSRDVMKLMSEACREAGLGFGIYFSLVDWNLGHAFDPDNRNEISKDIEDILAVQLEELMTGYGELVEIWFDMSSPTPEQSRRFRQIVKKHQPEAMINGRIGNAQGDFITLWDNEIPKHAPTEAWQTPQSIFPETWGYRAWRQERNVDERAEVLFHNLLSVRSNGGNYLLNIGPKGDGSIDSFEWNVLESIGNKLKKHSET